MKHVKSRSKLASRSMGSLLIKLDHPWPAHETLGVNSVRCYRLDAPRDDGGHATKHCRFHSPSPYVDPAPRLRLQTMALFPPTPIALAPSSCFEM
ncbi:hypothetical protein V6N13_065052 [Hibiscus sabdariffa]